MYIDKSDDIVNEYKNTQQVAIKRKPTEVKKSKYIDFEVENNDNDPKLKVGHRI